MKITTTIVHTETGQTRTVSLPAPPIEYTDAVQTVTIETVQVPRDLLWWLREDLVELLAEVDHKKDSKFRDEAQEYAAMQERLRQVDRLLGE